MTEETQAVEPTPAERERRIEAAKELEEYTVAIMRTTSALKLIELRDKLHNLAYRAIINARLRILRGLD